MKMKINKTIYNKLLLQAEEAKEQGMLKLANGILDAIGSYPAEEKEEYSYDKLSEEIHKDMWKVATRLLAYYDIKSVDANLLDKSILSWASKIVNDLELTMGVSNLVKGASEPKLPGEK